MTLLYFDWKWPLATDLFSIFIFLVYISVISSWHLFNNSVTIICKKKLCWIIAFKGYPVKCYYHPREHKQLSSILNSAFKNDKYCLHFHLCWRKALHRVQPTKSSSRSTNLEKYFNPFDIIIWLIHGKSWKLYGEGLFRFPISIWKVRTHTHSVTNSLQRKHKEIETFPSPSQDIFNNDFLHFRARSQNSLWCRRWRV